MYTSSVKSLVCGPVADLASPWGEGGEEQGCARGDRVTIPKSLPKVSLAG